MGSVTARSNWADGIFRPSLANLIFNGVNRSAMTSWFGPKAITPLEVSKLIVETEDVLEGVKEKLEEARRKRSEAGEAIHRHTEEEDRRAATLDLAEVEEEVKYYRELIREVAGDLKELERLSVDVSLEHVQRRLVDLRTKVYNETAVRRNQVNAAKSRTATEHANAMRTERSSRVNARIAAATAAAVVVVAEPKERVVTNDNPHANALSDLRRRHARLNAQKRVATASTTTTATATKNAESENDTHL